MIKKLSPQTKKYLTAGALVLGALALYGISRASEIKAALMNFSAKPIAIRNIRISLKSINFLLSIRIYNPTNTEVDLTGFGVVQVRRIIVYRKGQFFAAANVNLSNLRVGANGTIDITDIPIELPTASLLDNIMTISDIKLSDITVKVVVSIAGSEYVIET